MKRHITELEQTLIDKGFRLIYKTYVGKHSQKVNEYVYQNRCSFYENEPIWFSTNVRVYLNAKKTEITNIEIENSQCDFIDKKAVVGLFNIYLQVENYVKGGKNE